MISCSIYKSTCLDKLSTISLFVDVMFKQEIKNKTKTHGDNTDCLLYFKHETGERFFDLFYSPNTNLSDPRLIFK